MNDPILGLKRGEVKLVDHDPRWKDEFGRVKQAIIVAIPQLDARQIEHIGSTAIIDMQAKPVIDIAFGVHWQPAYPDCYDAPLKSLGFYRLNVQREQEIVFAKFTDTTYAVKTHFIHMIPFEGEHWQNMLFFRDYLNTHRSVRIEYERLKQSFSIEHGDINDYTAYKQQWIQSIFAKRTEQD
ncbi:GrpB family protein [Paenibacillus campi]|uniref:GrpB family protein n=1 Tax=Paenibacillus campi TaxID=3106031 RepID=UPI002B002A25|nr:GrpB family protein [Paenibacillus sp. SGZ-1009]